MKNRITFTIISVVFAILLMAAPLCGLGVSAVDENAVVFTNSEFEPARGEEFKTVISAEANPGFLQFGVTFSYDSDIVTLVSCIPDEDYSDCIEYTTGDGTVRISFNTSDNISDVIKIAELTFRVDENLAAGLYTDWLTWDSAKNYSASYFAGASGGRPIYNDLSVNTGFTPLFIRQLGDAFNDNNDGMINGKDANYILLHDVYSLFDNPMIYMSETDKKYANVDTSNDKPDGTPVIDGYDAVKVLQYDAFDDKDNAPLLGNRVNVTFYDIDGADGYIVQLVKSVVIGSGVTRIPDVLPHEGYENGKWSLTDEELSYITEATNVYARYDYTGRTIIGIEIYNKVVKVLNQGFTQAGKYIADDFQLPYKSNYGSFNMLTSSEFRDVDIVWGIDSGVLAQSVSISKDYVVDIPDIDYTTKASFIANVYIDAVQYGTAIFDRDIKGKIDLPDDKQFKEIISNVPSAIEENYRFPGYVSLEAARRDNAVNRMMNVDIKWTLLEGNEKGWNAKDYGFTYLRDENNATIKCEFIFDGYVVYDEIIKRTIPAKSIDGQTEYAKEYLQQYVPSVLSGAYVFPRTISLYDFNVSWVSGSATGKIDTSLDNIEFMGEMYQQIGLGPAAGYMENGTLIATVMRDGATVETFEYQLLLAGESAEVSPRNDRMPDENLYNALLPIFGVDDGNGGKKLTEKSLGDIDIIEKMNYSLNLSDKGIENIRGIEYIVGLRRLDLSGNDLSGSAAETGLGRLAYLVNLEQLILSDCNIDEIPNSILSDMYNIEGIDLSYNNLSNIDFLNLDNIDSDKGRAFTYLTDLFLHGNLITDISGLAYENKNGEKMSTIPNAKRLTLSRRANSGIDDELDITNIGYAKKLVVLWLANNNISDIGPLANCKFMTTLDLSGNNITAKLRENGLTPLGSIRTLLVLLLDGNNIEAVTALGKLTSLQCLSLSDNNIGNYDGVDNKDYLSYLDLDGNALTEFDASDFKYINENDQYVSSLKYLYLENNELTQITGLGYVPGLAELRLSGNEIESGYIKNISKLTGLRYLSLSGSDVGDLGFLTGLTALTHLELADTGLEKYYTVEETDAEENTTSGECDNLARLRALSNLTVLDISYNDEIDNISGLIGEDKDSGLQKLEYLYMDGLKVSDARCINNMTKLTNLSMQGSGAEDISFIQKIQGIKYLNLSGHRAPTVDLYMLSNSPGIVSLYLDSEIESVGLNVASLWELINLKNLSIRNIGIGEVDNLPDFENIEYLDIANTGASFLAGKDDEMYSLDRYKKTLKYLDVSQDSVNIFTKTNLDMLWDSYRNIEVYLYADSGKYSLPDGFVNDGILNAEKEGAKILGFITMPENGVKIADEGRISDKDEFKAPTLMNEFLGYPVDWSVDDSHYSVTDEKLTVEDYSGLTDRTLTLDAEIEVYGGEERANADYSLYTDVIRPEVKYVTTRASGLSPRMGRGDSFSYQLSIIAADTDGFSTPVKPVYDMIVYSSQANDIDKNIIKGVFTANREDDIYNVDISEDATLGSKITVVAAIAHPGTDEKYSTSVSTVLDDNIYYLTFEANGGIVYNSNGEETNKIGFKMYDLFEGMFEAKKTGYTFDGWYTDAELSVPFTDTEMRQENITIYAAWAVNDYEVTFDTAGRVDAPDAVTVTYDGEYGELPEIEATGCIFDGWFDKAGAKVDASTIVKTASDHTLYAHWTLIEYNITYKLDKDEDIDIGQRNAVNDVRNPATYNVDGEVSLYDPTRGRFDIFLGWYADAELTEEFVNDLTENPRDLTIYAKWDVAAYYNTLAGTPQLYSPQEKNRVVVDWSAYTGDHNYVSAVVDPATGRRRDYPERNTNIDIGMGVTDVYFIGNPDARFYDAVIVPCVCGDTEPLTIHFENFKTVSSDALWIYNYDGWDGGRAIILDCTGDNYIGCSGYGKTPVIVPDLTITGSGSLYVEGGNGATGKDGGKGIDTHKITVDIAGSLTVTGGNGGNGRNGDKGTYDRIHGGDGGPGGGGADAITRNCEMNIISGIVSLTSGNGGTGGNGGNGCDGYYGGDGYKGTPGYFGWNGGTLFTGEFKAALSGGTGGPGGTGGRGGDGGDGGAGGSPGMTENLYNATVGKKGSLVLIYGEAGALGNGGNGGNGGQGGIGGNGGDIPDEIGNAVANLYIAPTAGTGGSNGDGGYGGNGGSGRIGGSPGRGGFAGSYVGAPGYAGVKVNKGNVWCCAKYGGYGPWNGTSHRDEWGSSGTSYGYTSNTLVRTAETATSKYEIYRIKKNWTDAKAFCESKGGHLAIINSEAEQSLLTKLVKGCGFNSWTGGSDVAEEGEWVWLDGTPFGYTNWDAGEPNNNNGNGHYSIMYSSGLWDDVEINNSYITGFICEYDKPTNTVVPVKPLILR